MKKTILNIAMLATVALTGNGCKKFLNEKPLQQVEVDRYFKSVRDITASLTGVYTSLQLEMTGGGEAKSVGKYHFWGEARADNYDKTQYNFAPAVEMASNGLSSGNAISSWAGLYRTIGRANNCLKYIPQVPKYDRQATKAVVDNSMAQCYALRAISYFYIVRLWGDAPIWTEPYLDVNEEPKKPRDPKAKVIELIIADLEKAYELIPKNVTPSSAWYVGEGAICAIMADVYMWLGEEEKALTWFTNLFKARAPIPGPAVKLYKGTDVTDLVPQADWKKVFLNANTIENIWSIHWDYTVNGCACLPVSLYHSNSPMQIDSIVLKDWGDKVGTDFRARQTVDFAAALRDRMQKYYTVPATGVINWGAAATKEVPIYLVMYRLTDMMLLYAEAVNEANNDQATALKWLNIVRQRAGLPAYLITDAAVATKEAMQTALIDERRWELFGEGKRWFDLVRTKKAKQVMDPVMKLRQHRAGTPIIGFNDDNGNMLLWPIYRPLIENNPLLQQNIPYN